MDSAEIQAEKLAAFLSSASQTISLGWSLVPKREDTLKSIATSAAQISADVLANSTVPPQFNFANGNDIFTALDVAWTKFASKDPFEKKQGERELAAIEQFIAEKEESVESRKHLRGSPLLSCIDTLDDLYSFSSSDLSSSSVEVSSDPFVW